MSEHRTAVDYIPTSASYRPVCNCGWTSARTYPTPAEATSVARGHRIAEQAMDDAEAEYRTTEPTTTRSAR